MAEESSATLIQAAARRKGAVTYFAGVQAAEQLRIEYAEKEEAERLEKEEAERLEYGSPSKKGCSCCIMS